MRDRDIIEIDHGFTLSPFCECDSCNELCHYHYGSGDACIKGREKHKFQSESEYAEDK